MPQCCVVGCLERPDKKSDKNISFHFFPKREKSPKRYASWLKRISRVDFVPNKNTRVCSKHFEDDDFEIPPIVVQNLAVKRKAALKKGAVPSKFLRGKRDETVSSASIKRSKRNSKYVHQKKIIEIMEDIHYTSGTHQGQTIEELPHSFSLEVQCELGSDVYRNYWQPSGLKLIKEAEIQTKFLRNNKDSTY